MANEFYVDLPKCESWVGVIWRFVGDRGVGMRSRVKRREGGRKVGAGSERERSGLWREGEVL